MHYFVYASFIRGFGFTDSVKFWLRIFFLLSALSYLLGRMLSKTVLMYPVLFYGSVWMGLISIGFSVFVIKEVIGIFFRRYERKLAVSAASLTVLLSAFSFYNAFGLPHVKKITVPLNINGNYKIVQLSDLHFGLLKSKKWLSGIIDQVNALNPDMVVITGDLFDAYRDDIDSYVRIFRRIKAGNGIYAVTGNHEFYAGVESFMRFADAAGIKVLRNERIMVSDSLELAGVDDRGHDSHDEERSLSNIFKKFDNERTVILLSHRPDCFNEASELGVDLQFSGHLHKGQIPPMDLIICSLYKNYYGLHKKNNSYIYTTSGTGTWGPPMRLFSRSEIVEVSLSHYVKE